MSALKRKNMQIIFKKFAQKINCYYVKNKQFFSFAKMLYTIVIINGKIAWKHGPNRPFYAFMLRTKLY